MDTTNSPFFTVACLALAGIPFWAIIALAGAIVMVFAHRVRRASLRNRSRRHHGEWQIIVVLTVALGSGF